MSFWNTIRRKPEEEHYPEDYDDYEDDDYNNYDNYEDTPKSWRRESPQPAQPIRSAADMQVVLIAPGQYSDACKIADLLREMKLVVFNLSKLEDATAKRLLDFISGVVYAEDGGLMQVSPVVYVAAPYFVDLIDVQDRKAKVRKPMDF